MKLFFLYYPFINKPQSKQGCCNFKNIQQQLFYMYFWLLQHFGFVARLKNYFGSTRNYISRKNRSGH